MHEMGWFNNNGNGKSKFFILLLVFVVGFVVNDELYNRIGELLNVESGSNKDLKIKY